MTQTFPKQEQYELSSQLRRAAVSIPANIAEGYGRKASAAEFKHFVRIALGSCNEVAVYLDLIKDLEYIDEKMHEELSKEYEVLGRQLNVLSRRWQDRREPSNF